MNGGEGTQVRPLRPTDPGTLGRYRLVGRLGEGGMGVVYLAELPDGRPAAVKVIRADLSDDPTFRRRFRSEVERARQVPPFCTAEVIDADPDHDPPYLVVEYVDDGPDLATVVDRRGPMSPANLHGLAIGVATALTAIHGAGVIHRDLKPSNVLLALGSPKVIDFGIARPVHETANLTTASQVIGTVAYMSPERLGPAGPVSPAADIFAWGAVVAFAGTGRTPFGPGDPATIAARILTQPPDLTGVDPTLRGLVAAALAKEPTARPSARDLLDELLAGGPRGGVDLAAAFARQPDLASAAEGAAAIPAPAAVRPTVKLDPARPPRRVSRLTVAMLALVLLLVTGATVGLATGRLRVTPAAGNPGGTPTTSPPTAPSTAPPVVPVPSGYVRALRDPLTGPGYWQPAADPSFGVTCGFANGLAVTKSNLGTYRCPGPKDTFKDLAFSVDVTLGTPASCAGVWFRFTGSAGGYAARVCADRYELVTHAGSTVTTLRTARFDQPVPAGTPIRLGIVAQGSAIRLYRDGQQLVEVADTTYGAGRVILGIFQDAPPSDAKPFAVTYRDLSEWAPGA